MAYVIFSDGKCRFVDSKAGARIWQVLNGEVQPDERQQAYCQKVKKVYLNPENAPASYRARYPRTFDITPVRRPRREQWVPIEVRKDLV